MLRIHGRMSLAAALVCAGLVHADPPKPAGKSAEGDKIITLTSDTGKPRRCQVLKCYKHSSGGTACEVKDLETGEVMTVIESAGAEPIMKASAPSSVSADPILQPKQYVGSDKVQKQFTGKSAKSTKMDAKPEKAPPTKRVFGKAPQAQPIVMAAAAQPIEAVRHPDPVIRLIGCLRDEMLPSMREIAAESLAHGDGRLRPEVITALIEAAQHDPASSVRRCCVRCLGELGGQSAECVAALYTLSGDGDEAVRTAAGQALGRAHPGR